MTSIISDKSSDARTEVTTWTREDLSWLAQYFLAELCSEPKVEDQAGEEQQGRDGGVQGVKPGVIRHTSYPCQPLAYYYIRH